MRIVYKIGIVCMSLYIDACTGGSPDGGNTRIVASPSPAGTVAVAAANLETRATTRANSSEPGQVPGDTFEPVKGRRRPRAAVVSGSPAPLDFRPGPENSKTATMMNDRGQPVEVRVFKGHPQLDKVEAIWLGPSEKLLTISLRDGSTVQVKTDRIANLASAPADLLVELASGPK